MQAPRPYKVRFALLLLWVIPCVTFATPISSAQKEIATAKIHATVAAHASSLQMAHLHLHHVINCLVGTDGKDYSEAAEKLAAFPCKGLGDGALTDSKSDPALNNLMRSALQTALAGAKADSLQTAKRDADKILAMLDKAEETPVAN